MFEHNSHAGFPAHDSIAKREEPMATAKQTELTRDLAEGIASGKFPVGTLLPTEFELCERYETSRYAVRMALQELQDLGLISRRKNVGTRVEATKPAVGFTQSIATVDELAQFGAAHIREVHSVGKVVVDLALAKEMGAEGGSRWLRISSLRMDSGKKRKPICWTDVYIDPSYADVADMVRKSPETLISSLIEARYGRRIARIRQDVRAVSMSKSIAALLKAEEGGLALQIVRRYLDAADEAFEISVTTHPADRFTFSMQMERSRE
jgi:DNA-binding GntR family transcriptional regulator